MIVYAESSAVLAWLLGEPASAAVRVVLSGAERVVASTLTGVECARGLARARDMGRHSETEELAALRLLERAESRWDVHDLSGSVLARARNRWPGPPVRTLGALHLATALEFKAALGAVTVISLDDRLRAAAAANGLDLAAVS